MGTRWSYHYRTNNIKYIHTQYSLAIPGLDIIDPTAVRADLDAAINGARAPMGALSQVLATEVWLRRLETYTGDA